MSLYKTNFHGILENILEGVVKKPVELWDNAPSDKNVPPLTPKLKSITYIES